MAWQLLDSSTLEDPSHAEIGVTWGCGPLEEGIEESGALVLVLTALARQLERRVEVGPGRRGSVEVEIRLEADVCSLRSRGTVEELRAAWSRLPLLFDRPLVAEGLRPRELPPPRWVADVLARTGGTGYALQGRGGVGQGAYEAARRLLRELDPRAGTIGHVFWTDAPSLRGLVRASAARGPAAAPTTWASGEPCWRPGRAPGAEDGDRRLTISSGLTAEMVSVMLPRTAEGLAAAELLRGALAESLVSGDDEWNMISLHLEGMGEGLRAVLSTTTPVQSERRPPILEELLRRMGGLSDGWIATVLADSAAPAWLERGRRARGMGPEPVPSVAGVRRALDEAGRSIHLALDPSLLDFAAHRRLLEIPEIGPAQPDRAEPERVYQVSARGRRRGGTDPSTRVRLARSTLAVEDSTTGRVAEAVDLRDLVAVLISEHGTRRLIDRAGTEVVVRHRDLDEGEQLDRYLTHALRRVPHLRFTDDGPTTHPAVTARRRTLGVLVSLGTILAIVGAIALLGSGPGSEDPAGDDGAGLAGLTPGPEDAWSRQHLRWDESAELSNGTLITVSRPAPQPIPEDTEIRDHRVDVTLCGGAPSEGLRMGGEPVRPIDQNLVRTTGFAMYTGSHAELPAVEGPAPSDTLQPTTLEDGECTSGAVWFHGVSGDDPRVGYRNDVGDSITWSRDGGG